MENLLIELRKEKGISQRKMAEMLCVKPNTYNQYEMGVRSVPSDVADKVGEILGVQVENIFLPQKFTIRKV